MIIKTTIFMILFAGGVTAMSYIPWFVIDGEMLWLFEISLIDDITHGMTALCGLMALCLWKKYSWIYLILFGGYYACDALFFCTYGNFNDASFLDDFLLNAPHIAVSSLMLIVAYIYGKKEWYLTI